MTERILVMTEIRKALGGVSARTVKNYRDLKDPIPIWRYDDNGGPWHAHEIDLAAWIKRRSGGAPKPSEPGEYRHVRPQGDKPRKLRMAEVRA